VNNPAYSQEMRQTNGRSNNITVNTKVTECNNVLYPLILPWCY